jgi:chemotaxis protein methyltransferase CheR
MKHGGAANGEALMTTEEFKVLRDLVNERCGLYFAADARFGFERRVRERMTALGLAAPTEYLRQLRTDPGGEAELQELFDALATKETYFFREEYQLTAFREQVLPQLLDDSRARKRLSLWSAGCSTGEEAYSLAILLLESGKLDGWNTRVHGTDLSRRCVAVARKGVYADGSFRTTSEERKRRYFVEREDGTHVCDALRAMCQFGLMNLAQMQHSPKFVQLDAVFCKNVLIYFDAASRQRVLDGLFERLRPGGYLLLGHAESLLNEATRFEVVHLRGDVVYRKPRGGSTRPPGRGGRA